ncbi:hypothetical protein DICPUDRAFT_98479 [Dictyostelium purpureum]|uniref:Sec1-like family protein n=1 Tax=Dictyostelium purpureum TaxID=5786 RepID=F0ZQQ7_DICPU|nr:uncharacterized protein DICPUDRAFT_98479 [Dictyostelium purpureum]EGC33708.1 hypothetical protein DICPUDRAFT_98479 [Dictyostelium purpureum]|eukprot:XP_003289747.1 hypothetical protein DICPUDRAFT_98479 [Dictyostelium purpureum]
MNKSQYSDEENIDDPSSTTESNNIKLKDSFRNRFKLLENEIKDSHLALDENYFQCIDETIGISRLLRDSKSIFIAKSNEPIDKEKLKQQRQIFNSREYETGDEINKVNNKLVFFISDCLWNYSKHIKSLIKTYSINNLIIYCSMSELAHMSHPKSSITSVSSIPTSIQQNILSPLNKQQHQQQLQQQNLQSPSQQSQPLQSQQKQAQLYDKYREEYKKIMLAVFNNKKKQSKDSDQEKEDSAEEDDIALPDISCQIIYFPTCYSLMFPNFFTIPIQKSFFPSYYFINDLKLSEYKLSKMPENIQDDVHKTIHSFLSFLNDLKLGSVNGEDLNIFPIGPFSNYLANEIQSTLSAVSSVQLEDYHPISLILIDRTLDLVSPSLHLENSMDRVYYSTTTKYNNDGVKSQQPIIDNISIIYDSLNMNDSKLLKMNQCPEIISTINNSSGFLDGANGVKKRGDRIWDSLITKSLKESIMQLKRKLVEIISKENISVDISKIAGPVNIQSLMSLVQVLKDHEFTYRYQEIISAVCSIDQTLKLSNSNFHWDNLLSIEKILLLSAGYEMEDDNDSDGSDEEDQEEPSILSQICDIIETPISSGEDPNKFYSIQEILLLCTLAYSIKGLTSKISQKYLDQLFNNSSRPQNDPNYFNLVSTLEKVPVFSESDEDRLVKTLKKKILNGIKRKDDEILQFLNNTIGTHNLDDDEEEIENFLKNTILFKLKRISIIRQKYLQDHRSLIKGGSIGATYNSLLSQLAKSLFDSKGSKDFEKFSSSSLVGYLLGKTSWMSRSQKKKDKPFDSRKVIIYILGGITFTEIKELSDHFEKSIKQFKDYSNHQILIGSNQIITPLKVYKKLFE